MTSIRDSLGAWVVAAALAPIVGCGSPTSPRPPLRWHYTCGDPVCRGYTPPAGVPRCTSQAPDLACSGMGQTCDPQDFCNRLLTCASEAPANCPISLRSFKNDVTYVSDEDRRRYRQELLSVRLATYRYKGAPAGAPTRLGFVIDDGPPAEALGPDGASVDLYGYTSLAVAALQAQERELQRLRQDVAALRRRVSTLEGRHGNLTIRGSDPR